MIKRDYKVKNWLDPWVHGLIYGDTTVDMLSLALGWTYIGANGKVYETNRATDHFYRPSFKKKSPNRSYDKKLAQIVMKYRMNTLTVDPKYLNSNQRKLINDEFESTGPASSEIDS